MIWSNEFQVLTEKFNNGIRKEYLFENGYGASVICHDGSYGGPYKKGGPNQWEIAVLKDGEICYDTPITDDVIGRLNDPQVDDILRKIARLGNAD